MEANPEDEDMLREMQELLVDTVCSHRKMIRIAGDDKPFEVGERPADEAEQRPYPFCPDVSEREHHSGAEYAAVSAGFSVQCTHDHAQQLRGPGAARPERKVTGICRRGRGVMIWPKKQP